MAEGNNRSTGDMSESELKELFNIGTDKVHQHYDELKKITQKNVPVYKTRK